MARENYKKLAKLPPDKKQSLNKQWEEYNRLPEQERRKLGSPPRKPPPAGAPKTADAAPVPAASGAQPEPSPISNPPAPAATQATQ